MEPITTDKSNDVYGGPTPDIMDLPVERVMVWTRSLPHTIIYSVWEPTPAEREHVARGGNIKLGIHGIEPIPPVSLEVVDERRKDT